MMRFSLPTEAYQGLITVGTILPCQVANRNTSRLKSALLKHYCTFTPFL
jgi:hypothetical protein